MGQPCLCSEMKTFFRILLAVASWPFEPARHYNESPKTYYSKRYKKWVTVPIGFECDGSTWSPNIGWAWLFHDWLFYSGKWDDGTPILWREANMVMWDIMQEEGWPEWVYKIYQRGIMSKWSYRAWQKHRLND